MVRCLKMQPFLRFIIFVALVVFILVEISPFPQGAFVSLTTLCLYSFFPTAPFLPI